MKCPYCGIHYDDAESTCPVCGKRAHAGARKPSKYTAAQPKAPSASRKQASSYSAQGKSSAKHTDAQQWEAQNTPHRSSGCLLGCGIVVVLMIILCVLSFGVLGSLTSSSLSTIASDIADEVQSEISSSGQSDSDAVSDSEEDINSYMETPTLCLVGTWESMQTGETFTVKKNGSTSWVVNGKEYKADSDNSAFLLYDLTEDNAADYLDDDELQAYPPSEYIYCYIDFLSTSDSSDDDYTSFLYLPRDLYQSETSQKGTTIHAINYDQSYEEVYTRQ